MFGWIVIGVVGSPLWFLLLKEAVSEVAFFIWMGRNDTPVVRRPPLVAAERPTPVEIEGFTGMVIKGELA